MNAESEKPNFKEELNWMEKLQNNKLQKKKEQEKEEIKPVEQSPKEGFFKRLFKRKEKHNK